MKYANGTEYIRVSYYDHDCEWVTKYCDEEHRVFADVPRTVLQPYVVPRAIVDYCDREGE